MSAAVDNYNQLVRQQCDLSQEIQDLTKATVAVLEKKLQLATQQKNIQAELNLAYPELSVSDVQRQVLDVIVRRLEHRDTTGLTDWSCRLAGVGGNLE